MHDQPANIKISFTPDIVQRVINDNCMGRCRQSGGCSAIIGLPVSIRLKLANISNGIASLFVSAINPSSTFIVCGQGLSTL